MNNAWLGSFGEFVFVYMILEHASLNEIKRLHDDNADFLLNGKPVDVKSSRVLHRYYGARKKGILYAFVEFSEETAKVSLEGNIIGSADEQTLRGLWEKWLAGRNNGIEMADRQTKRRLLKPIIEEVKNFFLDHDLKARIIYSTCQERFGEESPDNLRPKKIAEGNVTVFLSFKDTGISRGNLQKIVAFPDTDADVLPMLQKTRLHRPKVDLDKLRKEYVFGSVDDLKEHYFESNPNINTLKPSE